MRTAAIIAECNPFHKGHEYLIRTAREQTGAERIIVLLSGDYVQRGIPAVTDRHVRAKMTLLGGADLVLSYPTRFATASAEAFAYHAVSMLDRLGCVDILVFGSESGDLEALRNAADFFAEENEEFQTKIKDSLKQGASFARARAEAAGEYGKLVNSPNNILAVEYLKALKKIGSRMGPWTLKRYIGEEVKGNKASFESLSDKAESKHSFSASANRKLISENPHLSGIEKEIPTAVLEILKKDILENGTVKADDLSLLLQDRLLRAESSEDLLHYQDVTEELAAAAFRNRNQCVRFCSFSELLHTKNRTHSAVNRALLHIALDIPVLSIDETSYYTQILGFLKEDG
ncbi:MAG: nucleotidyltransferase family protein [Lachnospiraceae bacterium]|nr:nucleotidyltransferase family protein [Lachnospiraceae bacterium]